MAWAASRRSACGIDKGHAGKLPHGMINDGRVSSERSCRFVDISGRLFRNVTEGHEISFGRASQAIRGRTIIENQKDRSCKMIDPVAATL